MTALDTFQSHVDGLTAALKYHTDWLPVELVRWERIVVSEQENGDPTGDWIALEDYEQLFQRVLRKTTHGRVDLFADRVEDGALHLVVRYRSEHDEDAVNLPGAEIVVGHCWSSSMMVRDAVWLERQRHRLDAPVSPEEFWAAIDAERGPGALVVVLLDSWKHVADYIGMTATGVAMDVFRTLCERALGGADVRASLGNNLFGAYWLDTTEEVAADDALKHWFPVTLTAPFGRTMSEAPAGDLVAVAVTVQAVSLTRAPGEAAQDLFNRAQAAVDTLMKSLPDSLQGPRLVLPSGTAGAAPEAE